MSRPVGTFSLVLHTHLPWLAHHGRWPVGEEWLHQAWAQSYGPLLAMLEEMGERGHRDLLTMGVTPVLTAQLDDPYCLAEHERWLADWALRGDDLAGSLDPVLREQGVRESRTARAAMHRFRAQWSAGGSVRWRSVADQGVLEVLGGPATHPVLPLVREEVAHLALRSGLDDHVRRLGSRPGGLWLPECAYEPGLERVLATHGVRRLMLDGPSLRHVGASTDRAWYLGDSDIAVVGRDLEVTYRVWSPRRGYPGGRWYRDFHSYHHESGFKLSRVTGSGVPPADKAPYDPARAQAALAADVDDFVATLHRRFAEITEDTGRPGLVVAGYDTELFGHWWHEGVQWLRLLLTRLPEAGIRVATLSDAVERHPPTSAVHPERGSWGLGKDLAVWEGSAAAPLLEGQRWAQDAVVAALDEAGGSAAAPVPAGVAAGVATGVAAHHGRDTWADALAEELLLACASDWPFMVSHNSSAEYAAARLHDHLGAVSHLLAHRDRAMPPSTRRPFGLVDARGLTRGAAGH